MNKLPEKLPEVSPTKVHSMDENGLRDYLFYNRKKINELIDYLQSREEAERLYITERAQADENLRHELHHATPPQKEDGEPMAKYCFCQEAHPHHDNLWAESTEKKEKLNVKELLEEYAKCRFWGWVEKSLMERQKRMDEIISLLPEAINHD